MSQSSGAKSIKYVLTLRQQVQNRQVGFFRAREARQIHKHVGNVVRLAKELTTDVLILPIRHPPG